MKGEFDRSQATQTLETTLDKLLDRLEDREDEERRPDAGQKVPDPSRGSPSSISRQPGISDHQRVAGSVTAA